MKKYLFYVLILIVVSGLFTPLHMGAQNAPAGQTPPPNPAPEAPLPTGPQQPGKVPNRYYSPLATLPFIDKQVNTSDPSSFSLYLDAMIKIFIGLCAVLAVIQIFIGGIKYMTSELISKKEEGKEIITGALLGLLLAMGAYALLNTINPSLLNSDFYLPDTKIEVEVKLEEDSIPQVPDPKTGKLKNFDQTYSMGENWELRAGPRENLRAGVTTNAGECQTVGQTGCTSIRSLDPSYINTIMSKCTACTSLVISGGTEFWLHGGESGSTYHGPLSPVVDLKETPELTKYIMGGTTAPALRGRYIRDGIYYYYEGNRNHWHVGP